ncbi:hypothetical protein DN402_02805 [Streptomyces sp. SW4]|nr:hypothetical protein DN402_02805 [Streptomyces sp. SW4]
MPGFSDQEMDGWGVPVPETVRQVLRAAGGLEADGDVFSFGPCDVDEDSGVLLLDWYEEIVVGAAPAGPHRPGQAEGTTGDPSCARSTATSSSRPPRSATG